MKWVIVVGLALFICVMLITLIGVLLPVKHRASMTVMVNVNPDAVWKRLVDFRNYPKWRRDVKSVEAVSDSEWVEVDERGHRLPLKILQQEPGRLLVTRIDGVKTALPFGGTWEFALSPEGAGTNVTITENGEVYNPMFRFVSKFIMGYTATIEKYAAYLVQSITP